MMFIKLDNGFLINLNEIAYIDPRKEKAYFKHPVIINETIYAITKTYSVHISESDGDRILAAMNCVEVRDEDY